MEYKREHQRGATIGIIVGSILGVLVVLVLPAILIALVYYLYISAENKEHSSTRETSENDRESSKEKQQQNRRTRYHFPGKSAANKMKHKMKRKMEHVFLRRKMRGSVPFQEEESRALVDSEEVEDNDRLFGNVDTRIMEEQGAEISTRQTQKGIGKRKVKTVDFPDKDGRKRMQKRKGRTTQEKGLGEDLRREREKH